MPGVRIGYARVSSADQSLEIQLEQLKAAGCEKIFAEKMSGKNADNRPELQKCLAYIREDDTLVVTRVDRLGRSLFDLINIVLGLKEKGVHFQCLLQAIDTTTTEGMMFLKLMAVFAEYEREIRGERQREGIAKAKEKGVYVAMAAKRKKTLKRQMDYLYHEKGITKSAVIATMLNISPRTVQRYMPGAFGAEPAHLAEARAARILSEEEAKAAEAQKQAMKEELATLATDTENSQSPAPTQDKPKKFALFR